MLHHSFDLYNGKTLNFVLNSIPGVWGPRHDGAEVLGWNLVSRTEEGRHLLMQSPVVQTGRK